MTRLIIPGSIPFMYRATYMGYKPFAVVDNPAERDKAVDNKIARGLWATDYDHYLLRDLKSLVKEYKGEDILSTVSTPSIYTLLLALDGETFHKNFIKGVYLLENHGVETFDRWKSRLGVEFYKVLVYTAASGHIALRNAFTSYPRPVTANRFILLLRRYAEDVKSLYLDFKNLVTKVVYSELPSNIEGEKLDDINVFMGYQLHMNNKQYQVRIGEIYSTVFNDIYQMTRVNGYVNWMGLDEVDVRNQAILARGARGKAVINEVTRAIQMERDISYGMGQY